MSAALDCEISPFERALVTSHVARCGACRSFEERVAAFTAAVRSAKPERLPAGVQLPARRRSAAAKLGRLGSVAAVVVAILSVGLLATDERTTFGGDEHALVASSLQRPAGVNDLVVQLRRPTLLDGQNQAIAFGAGGIGAYKPPLAPTP